MSSSPAPLATFVHISDLHIGQIDEKSLEARRQALRRWPIFNGLLGHSADSLMDLEEFFSDLVGTEPWARLIVTGDLTSSGDQMEFDTANQYLGGILYGPSGDRVGLGVRDWRDRAIPGNHDHWPGYPIPVGRSTPALTRYFPGLPGFESVVPLGGRKQLRLLRIDTDAEVGSYSRERVMALGRFVFQLRTLAEILDQLGPNANELRVLCLHHSPTYRGPSLEIDAESRTALNHFILTHRIAVLLCGHIHRPPWVDWFQVPQGQSPPVLVLEACCGTTTQIDPTIGRRAENEGLVDTQWQNSLFIHRLREVSGAMHWETELYLEGRQGFVRCDQLRKYSVPVTRFRVWPWPPGAV